MIRFVLQILIALAFMFVAFIAATVKGIPASANYGVTFSSMHAEELGLDWRAVYRASLDELGIKKLRIPAYWPRIEKEKDVYDWNELDYQIEEAEARDAKVILAIGRRVPRWPECHVPGWAKNMPWEEQKEEIRQLITLTVDRYKDEPAITHWQIENEPYFDAFANEFCGDLDEAFLEEEIRIVRQLDPHRPILLTDSGNLGKWMGPYKRGDSFGTSLYIYFSTPEIGEFKTKLPAYVYRMKERAMEVLFGPKETFLIELSLEPWLPQPTAESPVEDQLARMDVQKFDEIIAYARQTSFVTHYLWGVEWWYYMKDRGHPEFWERARGLFLENKAQ